jgi:hypothetical protein
MVGEWLLGVGEGIISMPFKFVATKLLQRFVATTKWPSKTTRPMLVTPRQLSPLVISTTYGFNEIEKNSRDFPFHVDRRGLKCIELDFDLLWI